MRTSASTSRCVHSVAPISRVCPARCLYELVDGDLLGDGVLERLAVPDLRAGLRALSGEPVTAGH